MRVQKPWRVEIWLPTHILPSLLVHSAMPAAMDETYGAMLIGVFFANFLQGILTLQTYIYFENFPDDGVRIKLLVASVWALDAAHLVLICHSTYHYLVTNWGVPAALLISTRPLDMHLIFVGASAILCQAFFINRIWVFSKNNMLLTALLSLGSLATFGLEVAIAVQTLAHPVTSFFGSLVTEIITLFAIAGAVDVFIALVLVYYLQRGLASTPFHRMRFVIARVMQFTVATGLATSVLAIGCLITYPRCTTVLHLHRNALFSRTAIHQCTPRNPQRTAQPS
ncbi:hypothetical protein C8F01DRAFT_452874 [Mycena amicta]|nr:hypothetical protein C8F01DRAFT_452874 [Mycena amicta]